MTRASSDSRGAFSPLAVLGLVGSGTLLFLVLLWTIGAGMVHGPLNDGGAHAAGKGLNGYAALADLLARQGWDVRQAQDDRALQQPGLLVLTPPQQAKGEDIARIVARHRRLGPTLVITPKWYSVALADTGVAVPGAKRGWVALAGHGLPGWKGFLDDVGVRIDPLPGGAWTADHAAGTLPDPSVVLSGAGPALVPLVAANRDARILAAYIGDGGHYPALDALALQRVAQGDPEAGVYPLVVVFEPDLLDNYGMAHREIALHALRLLNAAGAGAPRVVTFDLTLNGFGRSRNLLSLAFTPPFLAATLCLLMAALALGWRAFLRFGPARTSAPGIAYGKRALVSNAGGIVRRSGRLHLLAAPYAALVRERLAHELALPRLADAAATEAAIDRALAARAPDAPPFSATAGQMRAARRASDLLRGAQALHALERTLTQ